MALLLRRGHRQLPNHIAREFSGSGVTRVYMKKSGYFVSGLRKIEAATRIAPHIDPTRNASPSFQALRRALERVNCP